MKKVANVVTRIGCALLAVAWAAYQPALADCAGNTVFFGNLQGLGTVQVDVADPAAFWQTYIFQRPAFNQGAVDVRNVLFDSGIPGQPNVFGDWGGGLNLLGCPLDLDAPGAGGDGSGTIDEEANQVLVFGDSRGVTIFVAGSNGNAFDLDGTNPSGGPAPVSSFKPRMVSATNDGTNVRIELAWTGPNVLFDEKSAALASQIIAGYRFLEDRVLLSGGSVGGAPVEVQDTDGNPRDSHATIVVSALAGATSTISVHPLLSSGGSLGGNFNNTSNTILLTPGLAIPGKGKAKGHEKAPGQNR